MMLSPFIWGKNGQALTPDQVAALREMADAQRGKMGDTSPVGHWTAGAARVVDALGGVLKERRADKAEAAGMAAADSYVADNPVLSSLIGGGGIPGGQAVGSMGGAAVGGFDFSPYLVDGATRDDAISGLNPEFRVGLGKMIASAPPEIQAQLKMMSAYRSPERQSQLWDAALKKYGSPEVARKWVAPPGKSNHNHGEAVDLRYLDPAAQKWAHENAGQFGLAFPLANEPWHIEPASARGGTPAGGSYGQPPQQDAGVIAALAKAAADPWVQKKYGPVIDALMGNEMKRQFAQYEQQLRQADPAYQQGLELGQLQLDAARNPVPKTPDPFTLSPGETRYDGTGQPIASGAPVDTPRPMTPEDRAAWGIPAEDTRPYAMVDGKPALIGGNGVTVNNNMDGGQTPFSKKLDENFAADASIWLQGGAAGVEKKLSQLDEAMKILESGENVTGAIGMLPESVRPFFNAQGTIAQENVAEVVQSSLRETLGAQFTEKEGERLIARAFNPLLSPAENAKRVRRLIEQTRKMAAAKQAMVDYAMENGTLRGYKGPRPDMSSLSDLMASDDEMAAPQGDTDLPVSGAMPRRQLGDPIDFSQMGAADLSKVDVSTLTDEQVAEMLRRYEQISGAGQ